MDWFPRRGVYGPCREPADCDEQVRRSRVFRQLLQALRHIGNQLRPALRARPMPVGALIMLWSLTGMNTHAIIKNLGWS